MAFSFYRPMLVHWFSNKNDLPITSYKASLGKNLPFLVQY
ncbi:hypothetical protein K710_1089 [Streptococcus iniae SF1]|nr:hypothetical protein K710_1089 [Streptococcus iniae SF1]